jgi:hypothetical protein
MKLLYDHLTHKPKLTDLRALLELNFEYYNEAAIELCAPPRIEPNNIIHASQAHRAIRCPGSIPFNKREAAQEVTFGSDAALEGSLLHGVMLEYFLGDDTIINQLNDVHQELVLEALHRAQNIPKKYFEHPVSLKLNEFEIVGTSDIIAIEDRVLHVLDWKFGYVSADITQLVLYALAFLSSNEAKQYDITHAELHIIQPKQRPRAPEEYTIAELKKLYVEYTESIALDIFHTGSQCTYCAIKMSCEHRRIEVNALAREAFESSLETRTKEPDFVSIALFLRKSEVLERYIKDCRDFCLARLLTGKPVPGFQLSRTSSNRRWKDNKMPIDFAVKHLTYEEAFNPGKLKSPAQLEKNVKRLKKPELMRELTEMIERPQGELIIVRADSGKAPVSVSTPQQEFSNEINKS